VCSSDLILLGSSSAFLLTLGVAMFALRLSVLALSLALVAAPASGRADDRKDDKLRGLNVGDAAPTFNLLDQSGKTWSTSDHYKKGKWVVIYFYPGDFTPGCTAQANAFRDAMNKLTDKGVEVIGVSGDSVATHEMFKKAQKLNFTLLADEDGTVAKLFGVPVGAGATVNAKDADGKAITFKRNATAARWTFVIDKDGKVAYKNAKVTPADDAKKILEFITKAEEK